MANYKYITKNRDGNTLKGVIEATSKDGAVQSLRSKGLIIVSLEEQSGNILSFSLGNALGGNRVKIDEIVIFSRQLDTLISAGIPLVNSLDILQEQTENPMFKKVLVKVRDDVETGSSLSEALSKHERIFSNLFISMVKAGETSGTLDEIMDRLASYMEKTSNLQKKIKSAMVYPIAVTIMALGITTFLLVKIIPVFEDIYAGFGAALPTPTQVLIDTSAFIRRYFYIVAGSGVFLFFALGRYIKTKKGRFQFDSLQLNVPVFGPLIRKVAVGKFTRTLATLVKSGVPILSSLEIVSRTSGNSVIELAVDNVRENVRDGEPIADPLMRSRVFPPMVVRMISVGEKTGELEKMLGKIADFYDEQVDAAVVGLTSLIEPLIIAFLGIVVGGIVVCMFLPILKISAIAGMN
ncbi:MAG: type II secretion system F family protein [Candidatus Omnitrophota bacterium]